MGKSAQPEQTSFLKTELKDHKWENLSEHELDYIWEIFLNENNNTIQRISEITGYSKHIINKLIDKRTIGKTQDEKAKEKYRHNFCDSYYANVKNFAKYLYNNSKFRNKYKNVDLQYYVNAVFNWSEMNQNVKRTDRGWCATIRKFMDEAIAYNKVKMVVKETNKRRNF